MKRNWVKLKPWPMAAQAIHRQRLAASLPKIPRHPHMAGQAKRKIYAPISTNHRVKVELIYIYIYIYIFDQSPIPLWLFV